MFAVLAALTLGSAGSPALRQVADDRPDESQPTAVYGALVSASSPQSDQPPQVDLDRELARKIRRALVTDKSLSTSAHNIKIIARNGVVTLQGSVQSESEKSAILAKATDIAGPNNVKDQMGVKSQT